MDERMNLESEMSEVVSPPETEQSVITEYFPVTVLNNKEQETEPIQDCEVDQNIRWDETSSNDGGAGYTVDQLPIVKSYTPKTRREIKELQKSRNDSKILTDFVNIGETRSRKAKKTRTSPVRTRSRSRGEERIILPGAASDDEDYTQKYDNDDASIYSPPSITLSITPSITSLFSPERIEQLCDATSSVGKIKKRSRGRPRRPKHQQINSRSMSLYSNDVSIVDGDIIGGGGGGDNDDVINITPSHRNTRSLNAEFAEGKRKFLHGVKQSIKDSDDDEQSSGNSDLDDDTKSNSTLTNSVSKVNIYEKSNGPPKDGWDIFCWICHLDNCNLSCALCKRSYHNSHCLKSSQTPKKMNVTEDLWRCPECMSILNYKPSRDTGNRKCSIEQLNSMFRFAMKRLQQVKSANQLRFPNDEYLIVNEMNFFIIENKIDTNSYRNTNEFLSDVKWILHNFIVVNESRKYTSSSIVIAKNIIKIAKQEMDDIEACSECYFNANTNRNNWFVEVCTRPHLLLWAKLKGFPYWPAKSMGVNSQSLVDVRFFGDHDRSWVPIRDCYLYSSTDPNPPTSKRHNISDILKEVDIYINKIRSKFGSFEYAKLKHPYNPNEEDNQLRILIPTIDIDKVNIDALVPMTSAITSTLSSPSSSSTAAEATSLSPSSSSSLPLIPSTGENPTATNKSDLTYKIVKTADNNLSMVKKVDTQRQINEKTIQKSELKTGKLYQVINNSEKSDGSISEDGKNKVNSVILKRKSMDLKLFSPDQLTKYIPTKKSRQLRKSSKSLDKQQQQQQQPLIMETDSQIQNQTINNENSISKNNTAAQITILDDTPIASTTKIPGTSNDTTTTTTTETLNLLPIQNCLTNQIQSNEIDLLELSGNRKAGKNNEIDNDKQNGADNDEDDDENLLTPMNGIKQEARSDEIIENNSPIVIKTEPIDISDTIRESLSSTSSINSAITIIPSAEISQQQLNSHNSNQHHTAKDPNQLDGFKLPSSAARSNVQAQIISVPKKGSLTVRDINKMIPLSSTLSSSSSSLSSKKYGTITLHAKDDMHQKARKTFPNSMASDQSSTTTTNSSNCMNMTTTTNNINSITTGNGMVSIPFSNGKKYQLNDNGLSFLKTNTVTSTTAVSSSVPALASNLNVTISRLNQSTINKSTMPTQTPPPPLMYTLPSSTRLQQISGGGCGGGGGGGTAGIPTTFQPQSSIINPNPISNFVSMSNPPPLTFPSIPSATMTNILTPNSTTVTVGGTQIQQPQFLLPATMPVIVKQLRNQHTLTPFLLQQPQQQQQQQQQQSQTQFLGNCQTPQIILQQASPVNSVISTSFSQPNQPIETTNYITTIRKPQSSTVSPPPLPQSPPQATAPPPPPPPQSTSSSSSSSSSSLLLPPPPSLRSKPIILNSDFDNDTFSSNSGLLSQIVATYGQKLSNILQTTLVELINDIADPNLVNPQLEIIRLRLENEKLKNEKSILEKSREAEIIECKKQCERIAEETKRKCWCKMCGKEGTLHCCWNTFYCGLACQKKHWQHHISVCLTTNDQQNSQKPNKSTTQNQSNREKSINNKMDTTPLVIASTGGRSIPSNTSNCNLVNFNRNQQPPPPPKQQQSNYSNSQSSLAPKIKLAVKNQQRNTSSSSSNTISSNALIRNRTSVLASSTSTAASSTTMSSSSTAFYFKNKTSSNKNGSTGGT